VVVKRCLLVLALLGCDSRSLITSDAGSQPVIMSDGGAEALEASAADVQQETATVDDGASGVDVVDADDIDANIVDAGVYICLGERTCIEYDNGQIPTTCGAPLLGPCGTPPDPANDICVLRPGVLMYYYPLMVPYPGVDGGFVTFGAPPPECQHP
jgi:hypothetical protein